MASEFDVRAVRRAFDEAAATYDLHAALQREVATRLIERLEYTTLAPTLIVDLGAGTGYCTQQLERRYRKARVVLADLAPAMLATARRGAPRWFARRHYVCADARALPFAAASVDLIVSSLTLQWCEDLSAVFADCARVLKPGGLVLFSTLGPDTLKELRAAWRVIDDAPHVNRFRDMHEIGDALIEAGLSSPVMEREDLVVTYADVLALMRDLKGIGAHNSLRERSRTLTGRRRLAALTAAYEPFRRDGLLPATYEVVYGHAWAPYPNTRRQDGTTVATYPLSRLRRRAS
ncbi:MAG TPA: malonyl-ACP O-methyltransferase BioC [Gammaproteobacteria bacterium]|nr:malonyl-ACP O-methyltransferase BioC [Gammaproteobacteria bacterium]